MSVTGDGGAVIAHAGSIGLRMLAENTGLTGALSTAMARRSFIPSVHDRGQVLTDVAVMLADGGEAISDIDVLRHQGQVLGPVASAPTVWRALDEVTDARRRKIQAARARVRRHVWAQLTAAGGVPACAAMPFWGGRESSPAGTPPAALTPGQWIWGATTRAWARWWWSSASPGNARTCTATGCWSR